jgi:periplasmic protein TonB
MIGLSAIGHVALGAAFLIGAATTSAGSGTVELEAISVTIISATDPRFASSTGPAAVVLAEPTSDVPPLTASSDASRAKAPDTTPPPELVLPTPTLDVAALSTPPEIQPNSEPINTPKPPDPRTDKSDSDQTPQAAQVGGAVSAPATAGGSSAGQASASRGDMDRYARDVAVIVARNRPKGIGAKGQVTVEFTLSDSDGRLLTATVVRSSGSTKLDALAVSVIGKANYPPPPTGMTSKQLIYRIPFTFE